MKQTILALALVALTPAAALAGGILTNTNQNIAFNRMMSREASIGIDGVYSNPAGVVFMGEGLHLSLNWQMPWQSRDIDMSYPLFARNPQNAGLYAGFQPDAQNPYAGHPQKRYHGHAFVPFIPSVQAAWNKGRWSVQGNFAVVGSGGTCTFDDGLGSLERTVANTAAAVQQLAPALGLGQMFPTGQYTCQTYMKGKQYYFGLSLAAAYKVTDQLAVAAGLRGNYGLSDYEGYVKGITIDGKPLAALMDHTGQDAAAADITLHCKQNGLGLTPYIGVDYKAGRWNFSARYEFKTRFRFDNDSPAPENHRPDVSKLATNPLIQQSLGQLAQQNPGAAGAVAGKLQEFAGTFAQTIEGTLGEYQDGQSVKGDIPALLTLGVGCEVVKGLRLNAGFHFFDDKHASAYGEREKLLSHGTFEWNAGVEGDVTKWLTLSCGWQNTNYGFNDRYMRDVNYSCDSNSFGLGARVKLSSRVEVNAAYFCSLYQDYQMQQTDAATGLQSQLRFARTNNVVGLGVDINL